MKLARGHRGENEDNPVAYVRNAVEDLLGKLGDRKRLTSFRPPKRLYHYTDARGVEGILRNCCIHATNLGFMNDAGELQYARNLVQKVADELDSNCSDAVSFSLGGFVNALGDRRMQYYAACFCADGDLLSQWRAYADSGGGYAIGFDTAALLRSVQGKMGLQRRAWGSRLQQVDYDPHTQENIIRPICAGFALIGKTCTQEFRRHRQLRDAIAQCIGSLFLTLAPELSRVKSPSFREEQEWRIAVLQEDLPRTFRVSRGGLLVPYLELSLPGPDSGVIAEFRWGPTLSPQLARLGLQTCAEAFGYTGLEVNGSSIPLRT